MFFDFIISDIFVNATGNTDLNGLGECSDIYQIGDDPDSTWIPLFVHLFCLHFECLNKWELLALQFPMVLMPQKRIQMSAICVEALSLLQRTFNRLIILIRNVERSLRRTATMDATKMWTQQIQNLVKMGADGDLDKQVVYET